MAQKVAFFAPARRFSSRGACSPAGRMPCAAAPAWQSGAPSRAVSTLPAASLPGRCAARLAAQPARFRRAAPALLTRPRQAFALVFQLTCSILLSSEQKLWVLMLCYMMMDYVCLLSSRCIMCQKARSLRKAFFSALPSSANDHVEKRDQPHWALCG